MRASFFQKIEDILDEKIISYNKAGGGNPADVGVVYTESKRLFLLKSGISNHIFRSEANGLNEISKSKSVVTPKVFGVGDNFLLLEFFEQDIPSSVFFTRFGEKLAKMHSYTTEHFGFHENNYCGASLQENIPTKEESTDWCSFYFNKRLLPQYRLAVKNGYQTEALKNGFTALERRIHLILNHKVQASLLHGDLWSANFLCTNKDEAVLVDPAVYYGDKEADLAMTKLFGGFPKSFYDAYDAINTPQEGRDYRENIYKLYHALNHLNLFGKSYLQESESLLWSYL